jgi:hypothetical protein
MIETGGEDDYHLVIEEGSDGRVEDSGAVTNEVHFSLTGQQIPAVPDPDDLEATDVEDAEDFTEVPLTMDTLKAFFETRMQWFMTEIQEVGGVVRPMTYKEFMGGFGGITDETQTQVVALLGWSGGEPGLLDELTELYMSDKPEETEVAKRLRSKYEKLLGKYGRTL